MTSITTSSSGAPGSRGGVIAIAAGLNAASCMSLSALWVGRCMPGGYGPQRALLTGADGLSSFVAHMHGGSGRAEPANDPGRGSGTQSGLRRDGLSAQKPRSASWSSSAPASSRPRDGIGFDTGHSAVARPCSLLAREQGARICSGGPRKAPGWVGRRMPAVMGLSPCF